MPVATGPAPGRPTNAATAAGWVKQARTPANSALAKIERKGGARRTERTISRTIGSRLSGEIQNSRGSAAWALGGSNPEPDGASRDR